jgi:O-antigen/teichoic acid export membrane protein
VIADFDTFIKLYGFTYLVVALTLLGYLIIAKKIHFVFSISKVSRRFFRKIVTFCLFIYSGFLILTISQVFDQLVIAAILTDGMAKAGIFGLAQIMASVIQAPQRGIVAASIPHLARAWKEKNIELLQKIYQRSSINQLIFAAGLFVLIALNYREAIHTFNQKKEFLLGFNAFLLLGLTRIVDMGTGLNSQIIGTSNFWRFELYSGVCLLVVMLPLTYILAKQYDIMGPAIANFVSITLYNLFRILFLWKKFKLFPFTMKTIYTLLIAAVCFTICHFAFISLHGFPGLFARSIAFVAIYGGAVYAAKVSPDIQPVMASIRNRFTRK